ncbi:GMC oxidoreductase [Trichoderma pleuroticola]
MVSSQRFGNLSQLVLFFNSLVAAAPASSTANHHGKTNEYDYIVIGSGPGGGTLASNLALGGYSVLLLEAGDDSTYQEADVPIVGMDGRYWIGKTDPPEGSELLGIYYPRGATLGGSSMINGLNVHLPPDKLWDSYAELLGDGMTNPYMKALAEDIGEKQPLTDLVRRDPNVLDPRRDTQEAIYGLALHTYANGIRYSSRYLVQETAADICRDDNDSGILRNATARREVIVSGGAFNSPQILMLGGVGPKDHLESLGIDVVFDSPGVGQNLMDNKELPIIAQGIAYVNASLVLGYPLLKTNASLDGENDIWLLQAGVPFRGFWPSNQTNENLPKDSPGTWGVSMVKSNPQNTVGYVRLRTKDPRDRPEINFNLFASDGDKVDQSAMRETMNHIRRNFVRSGAEVVETACPSRLNTDGCCSDPDLRVRGVDELRVVDASSFPKVPGWFPALPTFMIAQKVSEEMVKELKH